MTLTPHAIAGTTRKTVPNETVLAAKVPGGLYVQQLPGGRYGIAAMLQVRRKDAGLLRVDKDGYATREDAAYVAEQLAIRWPHFVAVAATGKARTLSPEDRRAIPAFLADPPLPSHPAGLVRCAGQLRHRFWGEYSAVIGVWTVDPADHAALAAALPDWEDVPGERPARRIIVSGEAEIAAAEDTLERLGADRRKIGSVAKSIDYGEPFTFLVPAVAVESEASA